MSAQLQAWVRVSSALSCGCRQPKSAPIKAIDANTLPGGVVLCDRHQEYAVALRVSVYLDNVDASGLEPLFRDADIDPLTAAQIAAEQAR